MVINPFMVGPTNMVVLGIDKAFTNTAFLMLIRIRMRECLPLGLKV